MMPIGILKMPLCPKTSIVLSSSTSESKQYRHTALLSEINVLVSSLPFVSIRQRFELLVMGAIETGLHAITMTAI